MFDLWSLFSFFRLRGAEIDLIEANVPRGGGEIRSNDWMVLRPAKLGSLHKNMLIFFTYIYTYCMCIYIYTYTWLCYMFLYLRAHKTYMHISLYLCARHIYFLHQDRMARGRCDLSNTGDTQRESHQGFLWPKFLVITCIGWEVFWDLQ
jgi:hypothetical protein